MALVDDEQTVHSGQPIELYQFDITGGSSYYLTSYTEDLSVLGQTWTAIAMHRNAIAGSGQDDAPELVVTIPASHALTPILAFGNPPGEVLVTLRRYHGDIASVGTTWVGTVAGARVSGHACEIRIPSMLYDALVTRLPRVISQRQCNHILYDTRCAVVQATFTVSTTLSSFGASAAILNVASLGGAADQVYRGGIVERTTDGEKRYVLDQTGTTLTTNKPFRVLAVSDALDVSQGCDHKHTTCSTKFSNLPNFGGMPNIPDRDVFRYGLKGIK